MESDPDSEILEFARVLAAGDCAKASWQISNSPALVTASIQSGATRELPQTYYFDNIGHIYAGDTLLHLAAATYQFDVAHQLIEMGADVSGKNRLGAEPLHYAAVGRPDSPSWNPPAQVATIACLIDAGADPNAVDKGGATPLHRAVRCRCAAAVQALIERGADVGRRNNNGSTPKKLAIHSTGRSGSASREAKTQQQEILTLIGQSGSEIPQ